MSATTLFEFLGHKLRRLPRFSLAATQYPAAFVTQSNMTEMSVTKPPGRTYLHYMHKPEFRFGFGLSYGKWAISADADSPQDIGTADGEAQQRRELAVRVRHLDARRGSEPGAPERQTVLCFWRPLAETRAAHGRSATLPKKQLFDYGGVHIRQGQNASVACTLEPRRHLAVARESDGARVLWPGRYELFATLGSATGSDERAAARGEEAGGAVAHLGAVALSGVPRAVEAGLAELL